MNPNKTGREYWASLDDLADSPEFRELVSKEFSDYAPEVILSPTRRNVLKVMAASAALAGAGGMLSGCRRYPERKVAPYNDRPEGRDPGIPDQYATSYNVGGFGQPVLVSSFDGRPIKIEGNPTHPASHGAATAIAQASVLSMYDPQRSRSVLNAGKASSWAEFEKAAAGLVGEGFAVLSENTGSPTVERLRKNLKGSWYTWEPVNRDHAIAGARQAFGEAVRAHYHLEKAKVIVALDADPLGSGPEALRLAREWAAGRRSVDTHGEMNRLYSIESRFSLTGANADSRLPLASSKIAAVAAALAGQKSQLDGDAKKFVDAVAADLKKHHGKAVVIVGETQPAEVHALAHHINDQIGAVGQTVTFTAETEQPVGGQIKQLVDAIHAGKVKGLLILGGNPVYNAPADLAFGEAIKKVGTVVHLSHYVDETSKAATWHLPRSHYLEAWGDVRSYDGTVSVIQPLILPLFDTKSEIELLSLLTGQKADGLDLVRATFAELRPSEHHEKAWRTVLYQGLVAGSAAKAADVKPTGSAPQVKAGGEGLELVLYPDYKLYDGRFAPNGWLQELPDSLTKLVWDNAALIAPATAEELKLAQGEVITIAAGGRSVTAAVYLMPGQAKGSIALALGYGRTAAGDVGTEVGFDAYPLFTTAGTVVSGVKVSSTGRSYELITTQEHHLIDVHGMRERGQRVAHVIREANLEEYVETAGKGEENVIAQLDPEFDKMNDGGRKVPLQLWDDPQQYTEGYQWGMVIDLNACIGCGACVVACQAENNIGVVGKQEAGRGRAMHWIRVDRYFKGETDNPHAVHQPMTCHQCENAPCESVCPVAATTHDTEGLNVMVYNRCVGTRYCSNNCPYKVRRFNYFDWHYKNPRKGPADGMFLGLPDQQQLDEKRIDPVRRLGFNPEVTVRMRGVMEKCTFCVQRIKAVTIPIRNAFRQGHRKDLSLPDGAINPACSQTCPTQAITFGNLTDPASRVSKLQGRTLKPGAKVVADPASRRSYEVLSELNTRPRLQYLARINNPAQALASATPSETHGGEHHG